MSTQLGDVAQFIRGITFKPTELVDNLAAQSAVCMRTKNVQLKLDESDLISVPKRLVKREEQILREGDILVSTANSWELVGKCCWVPRLSYEATAGGFISILRARRGKADPRYLYHWFSSPRTQLLARCCGRQTTNISNMDIHRCLKLQIPLPPLSEQKRIAAILDQADALRAKRRQAIAKLDELLQSVFLDMFSDPVTNRKGWDDTRKLGDVAEIVSGITVGRKLKDSRVRETPYLAVINVQDRHLSLEVIKTIDATEQEIQRYRLEENDLLLTEGGDYDKLGRGTLWKNELPECIHQNHIFRVRLMSEDIHPCFLNYLVGSIRGKRYFMRSAKQTTGIASINMTQLRGFPLLIPPVELQAQFAVLVDRIERQQAVQQEGCEKLDVLFASLQQRAFKVEL